MYYPSTQLSRCARGQRDDRVDMAYNFFSFKNEKMYYPSTQLSRCARGQRDQRDDRVDMAYHFFLIQNFKNVLPLKATRFNVEISLTFASTGTSCEYPQDLLYKTTYGCNSPNIYISKGCKYSIQAS